MVNFGLVNEVEAGLGRFSGAADRLQVFPERSGYSDTDIGYLRIKKSDNGQKWSKMVKNGLFNVVLI